MKKAETHKLRSWSSLRGKKSISFIEVLSIQPKPLWVTLILGLVFGVLVFFELGPYSLPFGVLLGGLASTLGYLVRIRSNLPVDLRYMNQEAVTKALNEQAHKK